MIGSLFNDGLTTLSQTLMKAIIWDTVFSMIEPIRTKPTSCGSEMGTTERIFY